MRDRTVIGTSPVLTCRTDVCRPELPSARCGKSCLYGYFPRVHGFLFGTVSARDNIPHRITAQHSALLLKPLYNRRSPPSSLPKPE